MAEFIRVALLGSNPGGEVWSVNPTFFLLGSPIDVSFSTCTTIAAAVNAITIPTQIRSTWATGTAVTGCRVEARDRNGALEAQAEAQRATPVPGTATNAHPFQTAVVSSLRTATAGASGRGRLYWPATGMPISSATLRPSSSDVGTTLTSVRTILTAISAAIAASALPNNLSVYSRTQTAFHGVNRILMGDVLDTQRRRRDTTAETYTQLNYPS